MHIVFGITLLAISIGAGILAAKIHREYSYFGDGIPKEFIDCDNIADYQMMVKTAIQTGNNGLVRWALSYPRNIHSKEILDELKRQRGV